MVLKRQDGTDWDTGIEYKVYNKRDFTKTSTTAHGGTTETTRTRGAKGSVNGASTSTTQRGGYDDTRTDQGSNYDVESANDKSYKEALENGLNRKVDKVVIYSTSLGKELIVDENEN